MPLFVKQTLLLEVLHETDFILGLKLADWDLLIRQARASGLLGFLFFVFRAKNLLKDIPDKPLQHLRSDAIAFESHHRTVTWEARQIEKALKELDIPVVFLKGAAYLLEGLPAGRGRFFNDTDILVPKERLDDVEEVLLMNGWAPSRHDEYDDHYYREWMHELPPFRHVQRKTVLDVHHNILPSTSAHVPDAGRLLEKAVPLKDHADLKCLCPPDMIIHSAVHLFHEGEFETGLRDLLDLDSLLRSFGGEDSFWEELLQRGEELNLRRSLYYALHYTAKILHTPVPEKVLQRAGGARPVRPVGLLMDLLYSHAFLPDHSSCTTFFSGFSHWLLFVRSHYLRMPPALLIPHLVRKFFKRRRHGRE